MTHALSKAPLNMRMKPWKVEKISAQSVARSYCWTASSGGRSDLAGWLLSGLRPWRRSEQPEYVQAGCRLLLRHFCYFVSRTLLHEWLDEQFAPAYYEESDLRPAQKSGKRVVYDPRAIITHFEFASTGGINKASELQLAHRQLFCQKHSDFLSQFYDHTHLQPTSGKVAWTE